MDTRGLWPIGEGEHTFELRPMRDEAPDRTREVPRWQTSSRTRSVARTKKGARPSETERTQRYEAQGELTKADASKVIDELQEKKRPRPLSPSGIDGNALSLTGGER